MTLDGFLAFLALAAAIYAVVPPVQRLRAKLTFWLQVPLALAALVLTLYLEFFPSLGQPCPAALGPNCRWLTFQQESSFTPPQAAFVVVLTWMALAWLIHHVARPGAASIASMAELVDDLVYERRFAEAIALIEPHLALIGDAAKRRLPLQRWHDRVASYGAEGWYLDILLPGKKPRPERPKGTLMRRWHQVLGRLASLVPAQRRAEEAAANILRVLYRSADFRRFIAEMRPYFGIALLRVEHYERGDFSDAFFTDLMSIRGSVLYQELEQVQVDTGRDGYVFPETLRLLRFLFGDARTAEALGVWRPVAEYALRRLRPGEDDAYVAYLNGPSTGFDDERWRDTVFTTIHFFDVMVPAAARQGVEWHMWLYYMPIIVDRLVALYDTSNPAVDRSSEFPTRSARLIYEIFDSLGSWVRLVGDLPDGSPHREVPQPGRSDNGKIPASAAAALGRCMRTIALSDELGEKFATYMFEVVLRDIKGLASEGVQGQMRTYLIASILQPNHGPAEPAYGDRLAELWMDVDPMLRYDVEDFEEAFRKAHPGTLP